MISPRHLEQRHLVFIVAAAAMLIFSLQFSMVSVAFPELSADLNAPLRWTGWVLTIFMVGQVVSLPVCGRLAERFGRRNVFATGLAAFALASTACALSPNVYVLIAARAAQGLAGGSLMPSAMGLIGEAFMENRTRPIGFLGAIIPAGGIVGPTLGGVIVDHLGWRWTFGLNLPLAALVLVAIFLVTPAGGGRRLPGRFDFAGVGLLAVAATSLIFGLTELGRTDHSPSMPIVGASFAVALVAGAVLVRHELRTPQPVFDLELFCRREFVCANALAFLFGAGLFGIFALIPFYVATVYDFSASQSGAVVTPRAIALVISSAITAAVLPYIGYRRPIFVGMMGFAATLFLLSLSLERPSILGIELSNFAWVTSVVACAGIAFGFVNPALSNANLHLAPDRITAIAGLRQMFQSLGGSIGISLIVLASSRASSPAQGLEWSFAVLALVVVLASGFLIGIRDAPASAALQSAAAGPPGRRGRT